MLLFRGTRVCGGGRPAERAAVMQSLADMRQRRRRQGDPREDERTN